MRKVILIVMLGVLVLSFAGIIDQIKERGYIIYGTEATFPPFEYYNNSNQVVGFDADIANQIAKALGVKLKIVDMSFDGLIPALTSKKIDFIVAAMTITPEREKTVSFSIPYYTAGQAIVVKGDKFNFKSMDDLKGHTVAVQQGTTGDLMVSKIKGVTVKRFQRFTDAFLELMNGRVDAVVLDYAPAKAYVSMYHQLKIVAGPLSKENYGIAVRKSDTELLNFINDTIIKMKTSPYDILVQKWFGGK